MKTFCFANYKMFTVLHFEKRDLNTSRHPAHIPREHVCKFRQIHAEINKDNFTNMLIPFRINMKTNGWEKLPRMQITLWKIMPKHSPFHPETHDWPPGWVRAKVGLLPHQEGRRGGARGERHTPPHLNDFSQRLKSLITTTFNKQVHGEIPRLKPFTHLHCTERTWERQNRQKTGTKETALTDYTRSTAPYAWVDLLWENACVPWISPCGSL